MADGKAQNTFSQQFYPFLHPQAEHMLDEVFAQVRDSIRQKCNEVVQLRRAVLQREQSRLIECGQMIAEAFRSGGKLLAFGNGGSATDAQDVVADCMLHGLPALSLTNDIAVVTAIGNDVGFDNVFLRQIIASGKPGDIAFGISTSGNSRNVETAFEQAHRMGLRTVGLAGYEGGQTAALERAGVVEYCFVAPSTYIPRIQEAHATIYHTLIALAAAMTADDRQQSLAAKS